MKSSNKNKRKELTMEEFAKDSKNVYDVCFSFLIKYGTDFYSKASDDTKDFIEEVSILVDIYSNQNY